MMERLSIIPPFLYPSRSTSPTRTPAPSPDLTSAYILQELAPTIPLINDDTNDFESSSDDMELTGYYRRGIKKEEISLRHKIERSLKWIGERVLFILYCLLPSFLQERIERKHKSASPHRTGTTSTSAQHLPTRQQGALSMSSSGGTLRALNGIRGVACLIVFNFHFLYPYTRTITHGFLAGTNTADQDNEGATQHNRNGNFHQLPFICLLHRGRAAVCVFFALSGYVLSYRFFQLARARNWELSQRTLSSLAIRRAMRLYIPPTISMTIVMLAAWLHAFETGSKLFGSVWTVNGEWEPHPSRHQSFSETLSVFYNTWWSWSSPFTWDPLYIEYDPHLWTIPIEFRGSMVLFMTLLATVRLRTIWRLVLFICLGVYCMTYGRWDVAVFLGGAVIAEVHLIIHKHKTDETDCIPQDSRLHNSVDTSSLAEMLSTYSTTPKRYWKPYIYAILIVSLYLLSFPDSIPELTPGFTTLASSTIPALNHSKYLFWHSIGSILFVFTAELLPPIQRIFEASIPQYLGRISYALYLVHGPLQHSMSFALQPKIWTGLMGLTSGEGNGHALSVKPANYDTLWSIGLLVNWMLSLMVTIVVADLFWRGVDKRCVAFARWVEGSVSVS